MILYVNGDSHTAAAEAVVPDTFAVDDGKNGIDRRPHPANLAASWCTHLAHDLGMTLHCDAESASSNDRIIRTTRDWIANNPDKLTGYQVGFWVSNFSLMDNEKPATATRSRQTPTAMDINPSSPVIESAIRTTQALDARTR